MKTPMKGGKKTPATRFPMKSTAKATGSKISKGTVTTAQAPAKAAGFPASNQKAYRTSPFGMKNSIAMPPKKMKKK